MAVGIPPGPGMGLVDGAWLNTLAGGSNGTFATVSAAGTTQATATQIPAGIESVEVSTVGSGAGVYLPWAIAGTVIYLDSNGANDLTVYPNVLNNPNVSPAAQDTVNYTTSYTATKQKGYVFFCPKTGIWSVVKSA